MHDPLGRSRTSSLLLPPRTFVFVSLRLCKPSSPTVILPRWFHRKRFHPPAHPPILPLASSHPHYIRRHYRLHLSSNRPHPTSQNVITSLTHELQFRFDTLRRISPFFPFLSLIFTHPHRLISPAFSDRFHFLAK